MHVVFVVDGAERELDLEIAPGTGTVADLVIALTGGSPTGLLADGRFWPPDAPLAEVPLRQGSVLAPCDAQPTATGGPAPVVEVAVTGGVCAGLKVPLPAGEHTLGRSAGNAVVLDHPTVSPTHAHIKVSADGAVAVADADSKNGTVFEGYRQKKAVRPEPGQVFQTGAVLIRVGTPLPVDAPVLGKPRRNGTTAFNRPPRAMSKPTPTTLKLPAAPTGPGAGGTSFGVATLLAPVIFGGGMAVMSGNPMMAAFAMLSPVMMVANKAEEKRKASQQTASGNKKFLEDLLVFRRQLLQARTQETARRREAFPDPAEVIRRATGPSVRLWERRPGHDDFLRASVGTAMLPWTPPLDTSGSPGERIAEVDKTIEQLGWLPNAPLVVDLAPRKALGVVGDRAAAVALARQLICQLAVHHGPADLRVAVVTEPSRAGDWDWAKWLPHCRSLDETSGRNLLAAKPEDVNALLDELNVPQEKASFTSDEKPSGPVTLLVVDAPAVLEGRNSPARDVLSGNGSPACGLVLVPTADQLPALCTSIVELDGELGRARYREPSINLTVQDVLVSGTPEPLARACSRGLSALEDPEVADQGADLPSGVALVDLVGSDITPEALIQRWKAAGKVPKLLAPVGVCADGPLEIDLVSDGPHALIAGTTGSGKSELLRSVVAGLAATIDSEHLNFVLIDYKGGSAFAQCADLPHTVGMVTDLDEHLGSRALRCLEAELHYRETKLRDAGSSDLKEYLKEGHAEPLPRLVVIIDEFATMAAELPDFIDSLVGIAQRGRSLGVHMILATQRPGGAVNDNIRANTNLRISLRVQEPAESSDVVGSPLAAAIGRKQAGRGYVRLGASEVFPFQAALVTGITDQDEGSGIEVARLVFGPDPILSDTAPAAAAPAPAGPTDLEKLVAACAEAAREQGLIEPRRPWPETLPGMVALTDLADAAATGSTAPARIGGGAPFAVADDPDRQRRALFSWTPNNGNMFVCGVAGAGVTTTLSTIAVSLARTYTPDKLWLYALDFGTQALAPLSGLPHCGGVIGSTDRERQFRLVRFLADELERRRRFVAASGAVRIDPGDPHSPFPAIVLLVDNYGGLSSAWDENSNSMAMKDLLTRTISDGPGLGVVAVLSTDRPLGLPGALGSVVPNKIAMRLAEHNDLSFFGLSPREVGKLGPGRGVDAATKLELQVAVPHPDGLGAAVAEAVALTGTVESGRPPAIGNLPDDATVDLIADALALGEHDWFVPLGIGDNNLAPAGLRLNEGEHAFISGPARSGKSSTLDAIAAMVKAQRPDVIITAIALRRSPLQDAKEVHRSIKTADAITQAVDEILADTATSHLVLIDDADAVEDTMGDLARLVGATRPNLHVFAAGKPDPLRSNYIHWTVPMRNSRQGLALKPNIDQDGNLWNIFLPKGQDKFGAGRGYLIAEGKPELLQAAHRPDE